MKREPGKYKERVRQMQENNEASIRKRTKQEQRKNEINSTKGRSYYSKEWGKNKEKASQEQVTKQYCTMFW